MQPRPANTHSAEHLHGGKQQGEAGTEEVQRYRVAGQRKGQMKGIVRIDLGVQIAECVRRDCRAKQRKQQPKRAARRATHRVSACHECSRCRHCAIGIDYANGPCRRRPDPPDRTPLATS